MIKIARISQFIVLLLTVIVTGCMTSTLSTSPSQSSPGGRYALENDDSTLEPIDLSLVKEVVPKVERRTLAGNKTPYTINGVTYHLLESEEGYEEIGRASWYGRKFHGHLTSNGEIYDMFQVSAAHKTLPIPSYIRVTNLDNGKSIVARVNDRGPFYSGRIVDLSYAGASLLDYAGNGTARVRVEAIIPRAAMLTNTETIVKEATAFVEEVPELIKTEVAINAENKKTTVSNADYLQVGAFSSLESAQGLVAKLIALTSLPVFVRSEAESEEGNILHRVRLGPLNETIEIQSLIQSIVDAKLGTPFKIKQ